MFQLSQAFLGRSVMSLRTGGKIADTQEAIINPNNLKIEGFYCTSPGKKERVVLLSQDIRDVARQGLVVNDVEVLSEPDELVRLKDITKLNFSLIGKPVVTSGGQRLGKVNDFTVEMETFYINKIYVAQSMLKNISGGGLVVDRSQIVEITNRKIVVQDLVQPTPATEAQAAPAPATPA